MTQSYDHKGVTITPLPGGFYELQHASLEEPVRERGKEKAEQRADDIIAGLPPVDSEGHIAPQGALPDDLTLPDPDLDQEPVAAPVDMAAVMEQMAKMQAHIEQLSAAGVRTVAETEGSQHIPVVAPARYVGEMAAADRKRIEKAGHKILKIILEENESIPPTGLFIGHNGKSYVIQPGIPVDVPDFLVSVLDDAVMSAPIVNSDNKKVVGYRDRLKYAYRRVE